MIRQVCLAFLCLGLSTSLKYVDRRDVKSSTGDYFSCFYTINYNAKGVVSTKKSSVICDPDTDGGNAVQVFDLPKAGPTSIKHSVKAGKDTVKQAEAYTGTSSTLQPMNCSCKASFPYELMEVLEAMKPEEMVLAGRGGAGKFDLAVVDRLLAQPESQRTFLLSLLLNNIRTQIQAQIQALISSLTGPLLGGRKFEVEALHERIITRGGSFSNSIFSQLQAQIVAAIRTAIQNFLASLGIGRSLAVPTMDRQLLFQNIFQNCLAQIQAAIQNFLNAFGLGRTGLSSSIFSSLQAQILAAIQAAITNFLNSLGIGPILAGRNMNLAETERQNLGDLFGNFDPGTLLPSTDMDAIVSMILAEMGIAGGPEEMAEMLESEMAGLFATMEEMEQLSDEEIFQHVMEMMSGSGDMNGPDVMAMVMAEIEKPADCHCDPAEQPHGILA